MEIAIAIIVILDVALVVSIVVSSKNSANYSSRLRSEMDSYSELHERYTTIKQNKLSQQKELQNNYLVNASLKNRIEDLENQVKVLEKYVRSSKLEFGDLDVDNYTSYPYESKPSFKWSKK